MDNVFEFDTSKRKSSTEFIGPFVEEWRVTSFGYRVPYLSAIVCKDIDRIMLSLDERFSIDGTREEVDKWIPFIANAMAIAAGYSSHGENSRLVNKFKVGMSEFSPNPQRAEEG